MIEVGEYVRTAEGNIGQIKSTEVDLVINGVGELTYRHWIEDFGGCRVIYEKIKKHSKNIIDLIEVGDYVNGKRVFATDNRINDNGEKVILTENYDEWTDDGVVANKDIKTILTKEQYEANCYKVKEEIC